MALIFSPTMKIQLNGIPHEITAEMTVSDLLGSIGYGDKPCVVELDGQAVFPRDCGSLTVREGSRVEVVTLAAGG
jgi:sulfur carrier protein